MKKAVWRVLWKVLSNDTIILNGLGFTDKTPKQEVRERILPNIPVDYLFQLANPVPEPITLDGLNTGLPKIILQAGYSTDEHRQIPFLEDVNIEVHVWSKDETYAQNELLINRIRTLIEEETFQIEKAVDDVYYWSCFEHQTTAVLPLYVSDLYIMYSAYTVAVTPGNAKKIWGLI